MLFKYNGEFNYSYMHQWSTTIYTHPLGLTKSGSGIIFRLSEFWLTLWAPLMVDWRVWPFHLYTSPLSVPV